jgi:hypothetical protein
MAHRIANSGTPEAPGRCDEDPPAPFCHRLPPPPLAAGIISITRVRSAGGLPCMSIVLGTSWIEPCASNGPPCTASRDTRAKRGRVGPVETRALVLRALAGTSGGAIGGPVRLTETKETIHNAEQKTQQQINSDRGSSLSRYRTLAFLRALWWWRAP